MSYELGMKKLRIGVLFGGRSGEHEVSLRSARSVMAALDPDRREVQSRDPPPARGQPHRVASLARADIERATG